MKDLTDKRFGRLTAVAPTSDRWRTSVVWECRCDCGKTCSVPSSWLTAGIKRSCGCLQDETRRTDISGQTRGRLTAIQPTDQRRNGETVWLWQCECGAEVLKTPGQVGNSASTMCAACARKLKSEQATKMRAGQERDPDTNLPPTYLDGLRKGKLATNNTSGVRGVSWHTGRQKWYARMEVNGRTVSLGYYDTIEDAAKARQEAIRRKYGEQPQK